MSLKQYLTIALKHWKPIVISFALVGLGAYIGSKLMIPVYQSTALLQVTVSSGNNQTDYNNLLASSQLVQTEAQLATSDPVLRVVASHYPGLTVEQLSKEVSASVEVNTQLFEIIVQDSSPRQAAVLANDIAATLIEQQLQRIQQDNTKYLQQIQQELNSTEQQIENITNQLNVLQAQGGNQTQITILEGQLTGLQQHYNQWQVALAQFELIGAENGNFLSIVQAAQPALNPVQPNILLNTGIGLMIGLLLGLLLAVLFEQLDTRVRTPEALTKVLNWPVLTTIRYVRSKKGDVFDPIGRDSNVEGYRFLRTVIGFIGKNKPLRSLLVTSAMPRDGKSVISANLAISMARAGKTTLLIDANLRRPALHNLFGLPADTMGLSNAMLALSMPKISGVPLLTSAMGSVPGSASERESKPKMPDTYSRQRFHSTALQSADGTVATDLSLEPFVHAVGIPNLWVMPSGQLLPDPPEALDSKAVQRLLTEIANSGVEVVIFDAPPAIDLSEAGILASKMDGTLVVVDLSRADVKNLKQMKGMLMLTGAHVLGCVVNKHSRNRGGMTFYSPPYQGDEQIGSEASSLRNKTVAVTQNIEPFEKK